MRAGAFLQRQAARRLLAAVRSSQSTEVSATVRELAERDGLLVRPPERLGDQEAVRQADLRRLVDLARELDDGVLTLAGFAEELDRRFGREAETRGVNLLTYHAAKGLEFDAVFLPRVEEKQLPIKQAKSQAAVDEERRLLYVGLTRARCYAYVTWRRERKAEPVPGRARRSAAGTRSAARPAPGGSGVARVSGPPKLAPPKGAGRRRAGVRRLPRLDAGGDRPAGTRLGGGVGGSARRRADEARALRRRGARDAYGRPRRPRSGLGEGRGRTSSKRAPCGSARV